ncbi:DNA primase [Thauera sp.]|jgi:DNA primase|uniref:DNA primase n=1 Tax=Thauera sp. TaxID=1905334 RepID=UPI002A35F65F|nr:DNA primase [Thauera sp.]MDX9884327.1 DNA primase [Thauera sp.]
MIPQSFVQELLSRVDIVDVIERYVSLKKSGANYFACCPFHGEKSASFSVSPSKQFYHCFGCGVHGSAVGFLMEYSGLGFVDAVKELANQVGLQVPDDGRSATPAHDDASERLYEAMAVAARFYRDQLKPARQAIDYLKRRGLSGQVAARFELGYAPDEWQGLQKVFPDYQAKTLADAGLVIDNDQGRRYDRFRNRIIFPIHDRRGRIIAFGGRVLDKGEPKYLNSPETPLFEKGRELYGLFLAQKAIRDAGFVVVVEGYMDVVALAQFGIENAVATLGTATTPHHVHTLLRQTDRVVFCFDGDAAGRRAAWRALENALESLRDDATLAFLFLPAEHDPDSFVRAEGADAFRAAALAATPLARFLIQTLSERHALDSAEGRAAFVHEAAPLVTRISAPLLKLQVVKSVAETAGMTQGEVEFAFEQLAAQAPRRRSAEPQPGAHSAAALTAATPPGEGRERRDRAPTRAASTRTTTSRPRAGGRRKPPSTASTLLRLVLQHPIWAARLPVALIPDDSAEGLALIAIIDLLSLGEPVPAGGLGALIERFRDTPHGETLSRVAAELVDSEFDEAVVETLFDDTLRKLNADSVGNEIAVLLQQDREQGLDTAARHRLSELLLEKRNLVSGGKVSDL